MNISLFISERYFSFFHLSVKFMKTMIFLIYVDITKHVDDAYNLKGTLFKRTV